MVGYIPYGRFILRRIAGHRNPLLFIPYTLLHQPPFDRHITEDEYAAVCSYLELCEIENGYTQDFSSAIQDYIPKFDLSGL